MFPLGESLYICIKDEGKAAGCKVIFFLNNVPVHSRGSINLIRLAPARMDNPPFFLLFLPPPEPPVHLGRLSTSGILRRVMGGSDADCLFKTLRLNFPPGCSFSSGSAHKIVLYGLNLR